MSGRRTAMALGTALAVLAGLPAGAGAHAVVEETQPARGAALERAPERVELRFDEPVESSFGALRVFAADGERVDAGEVRRPAGDAIAVGVAGDLPVGAYTVTYRVVSADAHPVTGGYVFTVGNAGGVPAAAVADLLEEEAGPVTGVAFGAVRALGYMATALLAGGFAFVLLVWLPAAGSAPPATRRAFRERGAGLLVVAALAGLAATALGIVLQAATAAGGSFWSALGSGPIHDVLDTRFGDVWKLRFTAFGALAALLSFGPPARIAVRRLWTVACAAAIAYLVVSPGLSGHAAAGDDAALLVPLDAVHVAAMSVWVGGVAALTLAVPAATRTLEPAERTPLLAALVGRFSTVAPIAVAALLASGVGQSILQLDSPSDLVDSAFGRAIVVKVAIFAALVALGAHNRRRSQPALTRLATRGEAPGRSGAVLRRALRAEVALMTVVLAVSAALVSYSPSADGRTGPFADSIDLGPARMELTVDPARAGRNEIHVYLFDARSGAQYDRPRGLAIAASEPERDIGPIALDVRKTGPGHYTVPRADLAPAGEWTLRVRAPVSAFEEFRGELEVPIR